MLNIKLKKKIILIFIILIFIIGIIFLLSQTILFSWSPLRLGYNSFHSSLYDFYTKTNELPAIYKNLDDIIIQSENEHELKYALTPEIILCQNSDIKLYVPWLNHNNTDCGVWPKTVYVSTSIVNKYLNPKLSIKHELSHILILQNYGNSACSAIWQNNEWLPEGFAVYVTQGFPYYMSKNNILSKMIENGFNYNRETHDILSGKKFHEVGFSTCYSIYYHFVLYLIGHYGVDVFMDFFHQSFKNPDLIKEIFSSHFKTTFGNALIDFYSYLQT